MIYRCRQCGDILGTGYGVCYDGEFCGEICAGEYVRFPQPITTKKKFKEIFYSEKIKSRFEILDIR